MKNRFPREFYIPKGAVKVADKLSSAVVYLSDGAKTGRPLALGFSGKADKPAFHFNYRTAERREQHVREFFQNVRDREQRIVTEREKRKAFVHGVQVGDIYRTCWGYDQTNVEFFEVVEVKGKHAVLREIAQASVDDGMGCERCVPQSGAFLEPRYQGDDRGQPIRRLIQDGHIKICNVRAAWPWGKRGPGGVIIGEACHQTASGWGH